MNVNESTLEAAHRELLEETGYCGRLQIVGECYPDAYGQVIKRAAVALDCELVAPQELDVDEFAGVSLVRLTEFRRILRSGQMTDVDMGYMGLDFLGLL
jgi:ADP-ribose pyrophosphatase